jgi:hypothetical protein
MTSASPPVTIHQADISVPERQSTWPITYPIVIGWLFLMDSRTSMIFIMQPSDVMRRSRSFKCIRPFSRLIWKAADSTSQENARANSRRD